MSLSTDTPESLLTATVLPAQEPPRPRAEDVGYTGLGNHQAARPDALEMADDIAEYWDTWSAVIGRKVLPVLNELRVKLPTLTSTMICTADGSTCARWGSPRSGSDTCRR